MTTPEEPVQNFAVRVQVSVQADDFDMALELARIQHNRTDIGALVSFSGLCRDENGTLAALELEHYPGMAEAQIKRIVEQALMRWPLTAITVIHRYGRISAGEHIVLVITASVHRQAAFEAASFLMDFMKTDAPFWKKEHFSDGSSGNWISAKQADDVAKARWK